MHFISLILSLYLQNKSTGAIYYCILCDSEDSSTRGTFVLVRAPVRDWVHVLLCCLACGGEPPAGVRGELLAAHVDHYSALNSGATSDVSARALLFLTRKKKTKQ